LVRHIPNLISLLRLFLAPVVFRSIWSREYGPALLWCGVAGFTDLLDGWLARWLNVKSRTGAYLDPIADKVLLAGIYLVLGLDQAIPVWLMWIVFGRDAVMLVALSAVLIFTPIRDFPPTFWGKLSTVFQIVTALILLLVLFDTRIFGPVTQPLRTLAITLTSVATLWSALHYTFIGIQMLRRNRR
jgi:cardiolipin synthase